MKSTARVVVIGGGIAGCSTLFHLTQEGWSDVILLERDMLTSGTTWHSAAQVTNFGMNQTMVGLKSHSIKLYKELAEDPNFPINYHHADGGIRLAGNDAQMDGYRHFASMARGMGVDFEVIDKDECARRHPLLSTDGLVGGLWDPMDGDIDPAQICHALARRARHTGAHIYQNTPVTDLQQLPDDTWSVTTPNGKIDCEIVVNACGYRVNEVGAMMGVSHPVISMEHQYFLTEPIPAIKEAEHRMPLIRCPISDFYSRQEKNGLLVGFYEQDCKTWGLDGIDPNFVNALCPDDLDRVTDVLEGAIARVPVLADAGIHTIVNGPITYTIDGTPLVGPIPGKRNAFCIIGLRAGLGEGGGHGWLLAQQIVHGEAELDTWCLDPRRFGNWATTELTATKAIEDYQNEFRFHFPNEHRPAGRRIRTTPLYSELVQAGAEFTTINGWERADFFKPSPEFKTTPSFRHDEAFDLVNNEVSALSQNVGLAEISGFNRIEIKGEDAAAFLDRMICSRLLQTEGRVGLTYLLNDLGGLKGEATIAALPNRNSVSRRFWFGSAAAAERHDLDWLRSNLRNNEKVAIKSLTTSHTTLVLAGPKARDVLAKVSRGDWSNKAFPWLSVREAFVGATPATIIRVSYSGELAYELHLPNEGLLSAYHTIVEAGKASGLSHFGARATESMRIEKGYLHWKTEIITERDPIETGLDSFMNLNKSDFLGRAALLEKREAGPARFLRMLEIESSFAICAPGASVVFNGKVVGTVTSGAYGYRTKKNLAFAFITPALAQIGQTLAVDILGHMSPAKIVEQCQYDPENLRVRG